MELRPYQRQAVDATFGAWQQHRSVLGIAATGLGKTIIFGSIVAGHEGRTMIIAHRAELIWQAVSKVHHLTGDQPAVEMAELGRDRDWFDKKRVVVSTVQTQNSGRNGGRMQHFDPAEFDLLVVDECFPAGTLVDGRPIETLRVGDPVWAFDEVRRRMVLATVTRVFVRPAPHVLVRLRLRDRIVICTPNHPILTARGWRAAAQLKPRDFVYVLPDLRGPHHARREALSDVLSEGNGYSESSRRAATHAAAQPDEIGGDACACKSVAQANWASASKTGRQRASTADSATDAGRSPELADGMGRASRPWSGVRLSNPLQAGHRAPGAEDRGRGGRSLSCAAQQARTGSAQGQIPYRTRVDRVEVLERGSDEGPGSLCPDGVVYNLEVEPFHTYTANGLVVHNCHHATARSYRRVIDYFRQNERLRVLGVTATPDRADEAALGQVFDTVAWEYDIKYGIDEGWLVPIVQQIVHVEGLDLSTVRTTAGDLNGADLARVMEYERNLHEIASPTIELTRGRRTLIFATSVAHAERLAEVLNRHETDCARWVCGATPRQDREALVSYFHRGKFQYLVNVGIATEGFDVPGVEVVVMARPTKSRSLYAQMTGRGTRPLPGTVDRPELMYDAAARREAIAASAKPHMEVIDFVGNSGKHRLVFAGDILGGTYNEEVVALAKEKAERAGGRNIMEALEEAEDEIRQRMELERRAEAARRAGVIASARFTATVTNPFDVFGLVPWAERGWDKGRAPSEKMIGLLQKQGIKTERLTFTEAKQLVGEVFRRWEEKQCSFKQARVLAARGLPTDVSWKEANTMISGIAEREGWGKRRPAATPASTHDGPVY
jgi:superfamily II DNA or RNA helicase